MSVIKYRENPSSPWKEIITIKGDQGEKGEKGDTYTLTAADKDEIAQLVFDTKMEQAEDLTYGK